MKLKQLLAENNISLPPKEKKPKPPKSTPYKFLVRGDVFHLPKGSRVLVDAPRRVLYKNCKSTKTDRVPRYVGYPYKKKHKKGKAIKWKFPSGFFIVTKAGYEYEEHRDRLGGSYTFGDYYVTARRLDKNMEYDPQGDAIWFGQCGTMMLCLHGVTAMYNEQLP